MNRRRVALGTRLPYVMCGMKAWAGRWEVEEGEVEDDGEEETRRRMRRKRGGRRNFTRSGRPLSLDNEGDVRAGKSNGCVQMKTISMIDSSH